MEKKLQLQFEIMAIYSQIYNQFTEESFSVFSRSSIDIAEYHFGIGLWIRNEILSEESVLFRLFVEAGYANKDEMSGYILEQFKASIESGEFIGL